MPNRLMKAGYTAQEAIGMYGVMTGMAVVLVYVPTIFTAALSHTWTMGIAADWQSGRTGELRRTMLASFKLGWLWGLASGAFLYLYANELSFYIFGSVEAAQPIRYMAVLPLLAGLREVSTSILWAQNRKSVPIVGLIAGISLNLAIMYVLAAIPGFGYLGISLGVVAMEVVSVGWNLRALQAFPQVRKHILPLLSDLSAFILAIFAISGMHRMLIATDNVGAFAPLCSVVLFVVFSGYYIKTRGRNELNIK